MKVIHCTQLIVLVGLGLIGASPAKAQASGQVPAQEQQPPVTPATTASPSSDSSGSSPSPVSSKANSSASSSSGSGNSASETRSGSSSASGDYAGQSMPLGDAARKAKQQKKDASKPTQQWNNDNIPKTGQINVIGAAAPSAPSMGSADTSNSQNQTAQAGKQPDPGKAAPSSDTNKAKVEAQILDQKSKLEDLKKDADIAQRHFDLDSEMYYGKPDYSSDASGKTALDSEGTAVNERKAQVQKAQQALDDLQKKIDGMNGPAATAAPPPPANNNR